MEDALKRHPLPWRVKRYDGDNWLVDGDDYSILKARDKDVLLTIAATMNASVVVKEASA